MEGWEGALGPAEIDSGRYIPVASIDTGEDCYVGRHSNHPRYSVGPAEVARWLSFVSPPRRLILGQAQNVVHKAFCNSPTICCGIGRPSV